MHTGSTSSRELSSRAGEISHAIIEKSRRSIGAAAGSYIAVAAGARSAFIGGACAVSVDWTNLCGGFVGVGLVAREYGSAESSAFA